MYTKWAKAHTKEVVDVKHGHCDKAANLDQNQFHVQLNKCPKPSAFFVLRCAQLKVTPVNLNSDVVGWQQNVWVGKQSFSCISKMAITTSHLIDQPFKQPEINQHRLVVELQISPPRRSKRGGGYSSKRSGLHRFFSNYHGFNSPYWHYHRPTKIDTGQCP